MRNRKIDQNLKVPSKKTGPALTPAGEAVKKIMESSEKNKKKKKGFGAKYEVRGDKISLGVRG